MEQWVNIESDESVVEASVNDAMDVLETVQVVQNPPEMQSSDEDEGAKSTIERRTIPYAVEIAELFGELERFATECCSITTGARGGYESSGRHYLHVGGRAHV